MTEFLRVSQSIVTKEMAAAAKLVAPTFQIEAQELLLEPDDGYIKLILRYPCPNLRGFWDAVDVAIAEKANHQNTNI